MIVHCGFSLLLIAIVSAGASRRTSLLSRFQFSLPCGLFSPCRQDRATTSCLSQKRKFLIVYDGSLITLVRGGLLLCTPWMKSLYIQGGRKATPPPATSRQRMSHGSKTQRHREYQNAAPFAQWNLINNSFYIRITESIDKNLDLLCERPRNRLDFIISN